MEKDIDYTYINLIVLLFFIFVKSFNYSEKFVTKNILKKIRKMSLTKQENQSIYYYRKKVQYKHKSAKNFFLKNFKWKNVDMIYKRYLRQNK